MVESDGIVNHVHHKICICIEGKEILLTTKVDSLCKHVRMKKTKINTLRMTKAIIFYGPCFVYKKKWGLELMHP
jgi:hypothetical protein